MKTSTSDLALLRTYPQQTELRMSIFRPTTALACRVNQANIKRGARTVTFNTVTTGAFGNVESGMTMLVGLTLGGSELGKIRVRSATSTVLKVAENSNITWADNLYLTVLNFFDIVPIFPRIIQAANDPEELIFYKDYDIAYTNQNKVMGTFVCMGSHRELELDSNGTGQIYYTSSGTYNVNGKSLTYAWEFEGATTATSTSANPGLITYNTLGNYITKLTVTSSAGAVDKSYRYVVVNELGGGVKDWEITGPQGARNSGGYTASIKINSALDYPITPGAAIIISSKEYYGSTQRNIGPKVNQEDIFFVGYVLQNTIKYSFDRSTVEFDVGTISELMKLANGFAISVEDVDLAKTWYQIRGLNLHKAAYHFWRWHSTVLLTTDVEYIGTDWLQQFYDCNKESLYDAVSSVLKSARFGELVSNRVSKLWMEIEVHATPNSLVAFPTDFAIGKDDWIKEPTIQVMEHDRTSYLELGGILYSGPGDADKNSKPLLSCAPGPAPTNRGKSSPITGLSLKSQAQLNALSGDIFWNDNALYPTINMEMRGTFKNLDIAPQTAYSINVAASDTSANVVIDDGHYFPTAISWQYNHEDRLLLPRVDFSSIIDGPDGSTIPVPPITEPGTPTIPPIPVIPAPIIPIPGGTPHMLYGGILYVLDTEGDLWYTFNIADDVPVWYSGSYGPSNGLISGGNTFGRGKFRQFDVNDYGQVFLTSIGDFPVVARGMFNEDKNIVADSSTFSSVYTHPSFNANGNYNVVSIGCNPTLWDEYYLIVCGNGGGYSSVSEGDWYKGSDTSVVQKLRLSNPRFVYKGDFGYISYNSAENNWYFTCPEGTFELPSVRIVNNPISQQIFSNTSGSFGGSSNEGRHVRAGRINDQMIMFPSGTYMTSGPTVDRQIGTNLYGIDPSGFYMMRVRTASGGGVERSFDAGETWEYITGTSTGLTPFAASPNTHILSLESSNEWIIHYINSSTIRKMYYTEDFGDTWTDKGTGFQALAGQTALIKQWRYVP